jgi:hypothetical protein
MNIPKKVKLMFLPSVGSYLNKKYKVVYINEGKLMLTLDAGNDLPKLNTVIIDGTRIFTVVNVTAEKNQFNVVFTDFVEQKSVESDVVKVI